MWYTKHKCRHTKTNTQTQTTSYVQINNKKYKTGSYNSWDNCCFTINLECCSTYWSICILSDIIFLTGNYNSFNWLNKKWKGLCHIILYCKINKNHFVYFWLKWEISIYLLFRSVGSFLISFFLYLNVSFHLLYLWDETVIDFCFSTIVQPKKLQSTRVKMYDSHVCLTFHHTVQYSPYWWHLIFLLVQPTWWLFHLFALFIYFVK